MKTPVFALIVVLCTSLNAFGQKGQKAAPGVTHPLQAHVSASHVSSPCPDPLDECLYAEVTIDGKKLELMGPSRIAGKDHAVLLPGDYPARILNDSQVAGGSVIRREYELVFADGTTWHALVSGASE